MSPAKVDQDKERSEIVKLRCTPAEKSLWSRSARLHGRRSLSEWIRELLTGAVGEEASTDHRAVVPSVPLLEPSPSTPKQAPGDGSDDAAGLDPASRVVAAFDRPAHHPRCRCLNCLEARA